MITRLRSSFVVPALAGLIFVLCPSLFAQDSAALAKDLQTADAAHWPAINALLIAQRAELVAAHRDALKATQAEHAAALADLTAQRAADLSAAALAKEEAARLKALLTKRRDAESATGRGTKLLLLEDLLTEAAKPEAQREVETLEAEQSALAAKLKAAKARLK